MGHESLLYTCNLRDITHQLRLSRENCTHGSPRAFCSLVFFFPLNKIQWVEQPISPQSFFLAFNKGWLAFQIPPGGHLVSTFSCVLTITKQCFFSEHSSEDMYLLCFSHTHTKLFWPHCVGLWNQSSLIRDQTCTPCNEGQRLNHWTTREVPHKLLLF